MNGYITPTSSHHTKPSDNMCKALDLIKAVRDGPTPLPSTTLYRMSNSYSTIISGAVSRDSTLLMTGCDDSSLIAWDLTPKSPTSDAQKSGSSTPPTGSTEDTDPSIIRLGCDDLSTLNDVNRFQKKSILRGHSGPVYDVAFTARGRFLMSVSEDTTMRLWDLKNGVNKAIYQGHSYPIWSVDTDRLGVNLVTGNRASLL